MHLVVTQSSSPASSEQIVKSSTSLVMFGANGDHALRKLILALLQLHCNDRLPDGFNIRTHLEPKLHQECSDHRSEEVDATSRAAYYDSSDVLRDMLQNYLLQILTIIAMEPSAAMDPESLRDH